MIPRGRRSFKYGDDQARNETPEKHHFDKSNISRPVNIRPMARLDKFNPKEYLVAECSEHDIEIYKQIFDFINLNEDGMITPLDIRKVTPLSLRSWLSTGATRLVGSSCIRLLHYLTRMGLERSASGNLWR